MKIKFDCFSIRFLRWTVLVTVLIYACLLLIKLNGTVPLKAAGKDAGEDETGNTAFERLFFELESATLDGTLQKNLNRLKYIRIEGEDMAKVVEPSEKRENSKILLEEIFQRADTDRNELLDIQELARWIHAKITDHIGRAIKENHGLFSAIDINPRNGEVTWEEYHAHFLRTHGFSEKYISSHDKKHSELSRTLKESIMRDRARWTETAQNDPEKLTLDEFLAFTHPESSDRALLQMVEDLLDKFDRDGDEELTEDEFSSLPVEGMGLELQDDQVEPVGGSEDRRKEFRHLIDKDNNGKADRSELLMYINPQNPRHAIQEAQHLVELSDVNHDGKLNLSEILSKMDLFLGSKMVDTEKSFHDEFR